jgi:NitT/TauT family transport system permease protein
MKRKGNLLSAVWPPLVVLAAVVLAMDIWARALAEPFLLPTPGAVVSVIVHKPRELLASLWTTTQSALIGFGASAIVGVLLAMALSASSLIRRAFYPYTVFFQTVPIVAIAPLIVLWSGTGFRSVVLVAFIVSVFPIITNATAGLTAIDPDLVDLFRLHNASRWQTLFKLRLPSAVPSTVTGAKTSSGLAVIGTIVGEFFVGYDPSEHYGLGYLIQESTTQLKVDLVLCAVVLATALGLLVFGAVNVVGALVLRRFSSTA